MNLLHYIVRGVGVLGALGLFLLALVVMAYAMVEGGSVVAKILEFNSSEYRVIYNTMTVVDLFLLGFSVLIAAVGIYELFVGALPNMPLWLRVTDFDTLKAVLIKAAIVVMGISFMGRAVTWEGEENLLNYGVAVAVVIAALSFFLTTKTAGQKAQEGASKAPAEETTDSEGDAPSK
ncbi:MAG: YqhA family protein [Bacteroidota bacterium]